MLYIYVSVNTYLKRVTLNDINNKLYLMRMVKTKIRLYIVHCMNEYTDNPNHAGKTNFRLLRYNNIIFRYCYIM